MPNQTGHNLLVAYKPEATFNTAPGATSGERLRLGPSGGLALTRAQALDPELRADMLQAMARLGSNRVDGNYAGTLSVGSFDTILQAILRSTWAAAVTRTYDNSAGLTSLEVTSTSQITQVGTTTLLGVVSVGDIIRLGGMSTAANNSINLRVTSVTATVINVAGTPLTVQAADTACTLTVLKKLKNAATPTRRTFYIEEYYQDIDLTAAFGGCRFTSLRLAGGPDAVAAVEVGVVGASQSPLASGASPYYSSPTLATSIGLMMTDAVIRYGGSDVTHLTGFDLNLDLNASTLGVIGSNVSPDVFDNRQSLAGSITGVRQDLTELSRFAAETELELHLLLTEPESEPKDCISIFLPRIKIGGVTKQLGQDGAFLETRQLLIGPKETATGYDAGTALTICTSAA